MQDLTVVAPRTPIPVEGRSSRRVVHHKGDHILFSRDQINRLFWNKITRASNSCWEWTGALFPNGYGRISFARRTLYPHRVSYELHNGAIPEGLHIDHLCRNRACCNPDTAANTYVDPSGIRKCRTCAAEYRKRYKERRALSRPEADR